MLVTAELTDGQLAIDWLHNKNRSEAGGSQLTEPV